MTPKEHAEWLNNATLDELVDSVIWTSIMEFTAHCGWTDKARLGLVEHVREDVRWVINQKLTPTPTNGQM